MLYRMLLHDQCLFLLNFAFLGISPETAWRVMNCRQATHAFCLSFWVPNRNRLAVSLVLPGDASPAIQFSGLIMNCLAVKNTRQAMLFVLIRFSASVCSELLWFGGKGIFNNIWTKRKGLIVKSHGSAKESNEIGYE